MNYKKSVKIIKNLNWSNADPQRLVQLSLFFAKEFSSTTRRCLEKYGEIPNFQEFIAGEIDTDNLKYQDYDQTADHYKFLKHFVEPNESSKKMVKYLDVTSILSVEECMASLVSREEELYGIFEEIVDAHNWKSLGFGYFEYFLKRHIELDSDEEDGHEELTKNLIKLSEYNGSLNKFWKSRLNVYLELF